MKDQVELSVVMPCLNEALTLGTCIKKAKKCLEDFNVRYEIIVADNGSNDGSLEIAEKLGARIVHIRNRGYGHALYGGIMAANGKFVIMGDSDDSYDFSGLKPFVEKLREGYDLVMGNRFKGGIEKGAMPSLHRYFGNPLLSFIGRTFFKNNIGDFYCGLRGFSKEAFKAMDIRTRGMEFALEIVAKSSLKKLRIAEVPTTLSPDGRDRAPHLRTWRDGWRSLRFFLLFSPKWLFFYPGFILTLTSVILLMVLFFRPISFAGVSFDFHSLIYLSFILISGIQLIFFYTFARIYSYTTGMLPENKTLKRVFDYFSLEKGIFLGFFLLLFGVIFAFFNISEWSELNFQDMEASHFVRKVLASAVSAFLGLQIILFSFVISLLGLNKE